jgi:hypothetical protein
VAVRLDWDYDNDPQTGYTPYDGGNTLHVEYDKTDMNGNYYFSFRFVNSPYPANYYSNKIRVYATNSNSACFDHDLGNGAQISEYYYLDISSSTTSIYSASANVSNVEVNQGSALRYLYRARLFSINQLGYTPPTIRYLIRPTFSTSCFCDPDESFLGLFFTECQNTTMSVPRIIFNHLPEDNATAYHEYGHFIEWAKVGVQVYDDLGGEGHWFEKSTTHKVAWTEGWAEFYAAACLMYWYSTELPTSPEYIVTTKYQWMDYSQSLLSSGVDNKTVEGAVACFLYSLWDDISQRAPNYSGDNDDLSLSGSTLLNRIQYRWNILGELIAPTHVEAYKNALINGVDSKYHSSINALYNSIINQSGNAYSATPSILNISGNSSSRILSWNDNTAPTYYSWGYHNVDIVENNEQGFKIFRKATTASWDGTLNGYTLVGTVGQNTTTWTDNTSLSGGHSYVVVANNNTGNSLPRTEHSVYYQPPLAVTISGPSYLNSGQSGTWTASASGGTTPYHYQWWYMHPSNNTLQSFSIIEPNNIPLDTWFTLGTDSPTLSRYDSQNFNLKCVVTDATNTQVTSNIISVSVGGSLAKISGTGEEKATDILALAEEIPIEYSLGNYPNPFNPTTKISFAIPNDGHVSLKIFDILGREIAVLANQVFSAGRYTFEFNASNLPSGTYIYHLRTDNKTITKKMLIIK